MQQPEIIYNELSKAKTQDKRNIVISERSTGGFTMAQQVEVVEGARVMNVFLKGAFHVDDLGGLYNLRDALNVAIEAVEGAANSAHAEAAWDK